MHLLLNLPGEKTIIFFVLLSLFVAYKIFVYLRKRINQK
jgi:hypothetical protein